MKRKLKKIGLFVLSLSLLLGGTGANGRPGKMRLSGWLWKEIGSAWEKRDLFLVKKPFVLGSFESWCVKSPFLCGIKVQLNEGDLIWNTCGPLVYEPISLGCPCIWWTTNKAEDRENWADSFEVYLWSGKLDDEGNPIPNWTSAGEYAESNGGPEYNPYIDKGDYVEYLGKRYSPTIDKPKDARVLSVLRKRLRK